MRFSFARSTTVAVLMVLVVALLACKKSADPKVVKASCDMRTSAGSGSAICIDFHVEPNEKAKGICTSGGYTLAQTPCSRSGALGGCQKGNLTNWYYSSTRHSSAADVQKECSDGFVTP
jgi:hypothetical protein